MYVKQLEGKPFTHFQSKDLSLIRTFHVTKPTYKMHLHTNICQVFVSCRLWHIVDHLGPKIQSTVSKDKELKQNPQVKDQDYMPLTKNSKY